MRIDAKTFPVMQGEPHLGNMTEVELIATDREVQDYILDQVLEQGSTETEYTFTDGIHNVTIKTEDYIDVDMTDDYMANVASEDVDLKELQARAFVF